MLVGAAQKVERHEVGRVQAVAAPYLVVEMLGNSNVELVLRHVVGQRTQPLVDARRSLIVDVSLVAHYAGLHTDNVIHRTFLPVCHIAAQLELLCLEEVARVVLV